MTGSALKIDSRSPPVSIRSIAASGFCLCNCRSTCWFEWENPPDLMKAMRGFCNISSDRSGPPTVKQGIDIPDHLICHRSIIHRRLWLDRCFFEYVDQIVVAARESAQRQSIQCPRPGAKQRPGNSLAIADKGIRVDCLAGKTPLLRERS